jgi:hypothetical protein
MSYEWGDGLGFTLTHSSRLPVVEEQQQQATTSTFGTRTATGEDIVPIPEADRLGFSRWYANMRGARRQTLNETTRTLLSQYYATRNRLVALVSAQGVAAVTDPCVGVAMYMWWKKNDKDGIAAWHRDVLTTAGNVASNATCLGSVQGQLTRAPKQMFNHFNGFYRMLRSAKNTNKQAVELLANETLTDAQRKSMLGFTAVEQKAAEGRITTKPGGLLDRLSSTVKSYVDEKVSTEKTPITTDKGGVDIRPFAAFRTSKAQTLTHGDAAVDDAVDQAAHSAQVAALEAQLDNLKNQLEAAAATNQAAVIQQLQAQIAELTAQLANQMQYTPPNGEVLVDEAGEGFVSQYKWPLLLGGGALAALAAYYFFVKPKAGPAPGLAGMQRNPMWNPRKGRKYQKKLGPPREGMVWRKGYVRHVCGPQSVPGQWVRPSRKKKAAAPTWGAWGEL